MPAIQITVHLPEHFKSIEPLETSVNDAGQKVKQRLLLRHLHRLLPEKNSFPKSPLLAPVVGTKPGQSVDDGENC